MAVLVTGGSGFLGKCLKLYRPDWEYVSSKDVNLLDYVDTKKMLLNVNPSAIVHLAAKVGGIKTNDENPVKFLEDNITINSNVLKAAHECGINRILSAISTCAFPDVVQSYPFTEDDFLNGPPAETNLSYGYAKRLLHIQSLAYNKQYNRKYTTFAPSNLYGKYDNFDSNNSHFVASLVKKLEKAEVNEEIELWGTGEPLRQQLYIDDLCIIIPLLLEKHLSNIPLIVAPNENISIKKMAKIGSNISKKQVNFVFNGKLDGQYRKDGSNKKLLEMIGNFNFTTFEDGFKNTYEWWCKNKHD